MTFAAIDGKIRKQVFDWYKRISADQVYRQKEGDDKELTFERILRPSAYKQDGVWTIRKS
jgi:hypothetical protein